MELFFTLALNSSSCTCGTPWCRSRIFPATMSFLESCCDNQNSSKALLFVGIDVISRLRLRQLLHTPPFLLEPLHVDPVLLHHIVQRVIVEDVWRGSGLHVRIKKQTMVGNSNQSNCQFFLSIHRRNKAPSRCLWLDRLVGRKLP